MVRRRMVRRHTSRLVVWVAMDGFPNTMILAAEGQLCVPPGSSVGGDADTEPHVSQQLYVDVTPTHLKLVLMVIGFLPTRLLSLLRPNGRLRTPHPRPRIPINPSITYHISNNDAHNLGSCLYLPSAL